MEGKGTASKFTWTGDDGVKYEATPDDFAATIQAHPAKKEDDGSATLDMSGQTADGVTIKQTIKLPHGQAGQATQTAAGIVKDFIAKTGIVPKPVGSTSTSTVTGRINPATGQPVTEPEVTTRTTVPGTGMQQPQAPAASSATQLQDAPPGFQEGAVYQSKDSDTFYRVTNGKMVPVNAPVAAPAPTAAAPAPSGQMPAPPDSPLAGIPTPDERDAQGELARTRMEQMLSGQMPALTTSTPTLPSVAGDIQGTRQTQIAKLASILKRGDLDSDAYRSTYNQLVDLLNGKPAASPPAQAAPFNLLSVPGS